VAATPRHCSTKEKTTLQPTPIHQQTSSKKEKRIMDETTMKKIMIRMNLKLLH